MSGRVKYISLLESFVSLLVTLLVTLLLQQKVFIKDDSRKI